MAPLTTEPTPKTDIKPATPAQPAVTRPADEIEDPYVWKSVGAFGPQAVQPKAMPQPACVPDAAPEAGSATDDGATVNWLQWKEFLAGIALGAISVALLAIVFRIERR